MSTEPNHKDAVLRAIEDAANACSYAVKGFLRTQSILDAIASDPELSDLLDQAIFYQGCATEKFNAMIERVKRKPR